MLLVTVMLKLERHFWSDLSSAYMAIWWPKNVEIIINIIHITDFPVLDEINYSNSQ
jgi:hypothetical protein